MNEPTGDEPYGDLVAAEVRAHLARRSISGRELARHLSEQQNWVSRRLSGVVPLTVNDLARIAGVIGVSPAELLPNGR